MAACEPLAEFFTHSNPDFSSNRGGFYPLKTGIFRETSGTKPTRNILFIEIEWVSADPSPISSRRKGRSRLFSNAAFIKLIIAQKDGSAEPSFLINMYFKLSFNAD